MADYPDYGDFDGLDSDFDWDSVEHVHIERDSDGTWDVWFEMEDGSTVEAGEFDDEDAQEIIWEDLYDWMMDEGIEYDKEIDY